MAEIVEGRYFRRTGFPVDCRTLCNLRSANIKFRMVTFERMCHILSAYIRFKKIFHAIIETEIQKVLLLLLVF